jgi:Skp family chaperone for outer membrane proteins
MKKLCLFLLLACSLTFVAAAQANNDQAAPQKHGMMAGHHQQMQALLEKVNSTWKEVETATTPQAKEGALKAHGAALAEMNAAHQKMASAGDQEMMKMCQEMMAKHDTSHQTKAPK